MALGPRLGGATGGTRHAGRSSSKQKPAASLSQRKSVQGAIARKTCSGLLACCKGHRMAGHRRPRWGCGSVLHRGVRHR
eukprot:1827468-Alexandrium_andersonii.AAC.1